MASASASEGSVSKARRSGASGALRGKDLDSITMEFDEVGEGAGVVAVVFGAVVKCCAVGSEGRSDEDAAAGKCGCGFAGQCH